MSLLAFVLLVMRWASTKRPVSCTRRGASQRDRASCGMHARLRDAVQMVCTGLVWHMKQVVRCSCSTATGSTAMSKGTSVISSNRTLTVCPM